MAFERYNLHNLKKAVRDPSLFKYEIYRLGEKTKSFGPNLIKKVNNWRFVRSYGEGRDFMCKDWDNLIILDACRYDYFEEFNPMDGYLSSIVSKGAHSWEFMEGNFVGRKFHDTVYVTANPHVVKLPDDTFHHVITLFDEWDDNPGTVLPESVYTAALEAHKNFPDKKLIVHFMQPHGPHLGQTAEEYRDRLDLRGWNPPEENQPGLRWDHAATEGHVSRQDIRDAYSETLELVLGHVENLVNQLDGKSVVTADHGQMLGERIAPLTSPIYGHPHDIYTRELCIVPWFEIESGPRRRIRSDEPVVNGFVNEDVVNQRLRDLGYVPG